MLYHKMMQAFRNYCTKFALYALVLGTLSAVSCTPPVPPQDGVMLHTGDQFIALKRIAARELGRDPLKLSTIEAIPKVEYAKHIMLRNIQGAESIVWSIPESIPLEKDQARSGIGTMEPHKENAAVSIVNFEPQLPGGLVLLRLKGGNASGWYPFVVGHNAAWSFMVGKANFANGKNAEALAAFDKSIDLDPSASAYWYKAYTKIRLAQMDDLVDIAQDALDELGEGDDKVLYQILYAEAKMRTGDYAQSLELFDELKLNHPGDTRIKKKLGQLLNTVEPAPSTLVSDIYKVARKQGADGLEDFVLESDLDQLGERGIRDFTQFLIKYGSVKNLQIRSEKRFGRLATVDYTVRFTKGAKLDRTMQFFLNDEGKYKVRLQ